MPGTIERQCAETIVEKRVLLVEDDASLARSIVNGLSDEGFAVAHAADGDAARGGAAGRGRGTSSSSTGGCPAGTAWRS